MPGSRLKQRGSGAKGELLGIGKLARSLKKNREESAG